MNKSRDKISYSKTTLSCLFLLVTSVVLYLYFLNMSVVHVVMRTEFTQEQNTLRTDIAMLEARYIESQHTIASRISTLQGYETDVAKIFVSREPASLVLRDE
jgi:predicted transcriptional regulator